MREPPDDAQNTSGGRFGSIAAILSVAVMCALCFVLLHHPKAPQLEFTTIEGQKFDTSSLQGKVVLVNFWATSCAYCVHEMPGVVDTYRRFHDQGLEVVAVAMSYDPPSYVAQYASERHLPFRVTLDLAGQAARSFGNVDATPTTVVIDRSGHIVARLIGELQFEALNAFLQKQLAAPAGNA